jgi:3'(2'), 5'-bisphosphate nucleotidase
LIKESIVASSSLKGCRAAKQGIVEETRGVFRQMDGSEMVYNRGNTLNEKGIYVVN